MTLPSTGDLLLHRLDPGELPPAGWTLHVSADGQRVCYRTCTGDEPFSVLSTVYWVPRRGKRYIVGN
jgi:hypothetical protein